ncbi:MAG TPA: hypothetical protein DDY22_04620 [Geobacter sp.]|nr:hypothetical protein [Geobacter sp.]
MLIQSALCSTTVWAAKKNAAAAPAIEMSETARAEAAGPGALAPETDPVEEQDQGPPREDAAPGAEPQAAESAADPAADPAAEAAAEAADDEAAPAAPAVPETPVSWWREAASLLGLAPDPRPGETAEPAPGRPLRAQDYVIGSGDLLGISVWRDENLTRSVVVLPDGRISFPLVGELVAGGKTVSQLKRELEGKLTRYISDAGLTVEVKQSNSMVVYIIGRVNAPGRQMMGDSTNVLQALAMAGGLNPYASKSDLKVFRRQGGKTTVFPFDYREVVEGRHLETNIELQRGDVVIVP